MAIRRNYFFENITEEDPTKAVADPNLLDYDKTDSYSQTTPVGDEGVAGTVDTDLGDGKEEEIKGDGTPTLEEAMLEDLVVEEMTEMLLEAKIKTKEDLEDQLKKLDGKPNGNAKAFGLFKAIVGGGYFGLSAGATAANTGRLAATLPGAVRTASAIGKYSGVKGLAAGTAGIGLAGIGIGVLWTWACIKIVKFMLRQPGSPAQNVKDAQKVIKEVDKAIKKAEKDKATADDKQKKQLDKFITQLKAAREKAQKKIDQEQAKYNGKADKMLFNTESAETSIEPDFDAYIESIFADIDSSETESVVESEAPEPQPTVFEAFYGDDYINNVIAVAMNESYAQDLALMNYITSMHESMKAIREADEETQSQVNEAKKKSLKERISGIIKAFTEGVKKVFDKIIGFFQDRAKDFSRFVDKFKTKLGKHGDEEVEGDDFIGSFEAKFEKDISPDDLDDIPEVDATVVEHLLMLAEKNDLVPASQGGADGKSKRMRYKIKDLLKHFSALLNKIPVLGRFKKFVYGKIKNIQRKIDAKIASLDDESKIRKIMNGFTEWKKKCMGAIHKASETLKKAWGAVTGAIKAAVGKIFKKGEKDKQEKEGETKNEMALYVSEAALGELIYSEYMAEEAGECGEKDDCKAGDVTQVADGVDVTDVIDGVIEKDETVTKEKTVSINNESYRVKVSATRL